MPADGWYSQYCLPAMNDTHIHNYIDRVSGYLTVKRFNRTITLLVAALAYGSETCCFTLVKLFMEISGPERQEVTGEWWRKLHARNLNFQEGCDGQGMWHAYGDVKYVGNKSRGRHRRRWKDNIKVDFKGIGLKMVSSGSGQGQVAGCCECGNELSGSIKREGFIHYLRKLVGQAGLCSLWLVN